MKTIRKPDLNAPRFRESTSKVLTVDTFKKFIKENPKYKGMDYKLFKDTIKAFNGNIWQGVIDNRNGVELPEGLGYIFIGTCESSKKKNVDYKKSFEYGVEATHRNWDSDNKLCKIFYTNNNTKYPLSNKQVWSFTAVRQFKRSASSAYKEDWMKYIEVAPDNKISAMFTRHKRRQYMEKLNSQVPQDYDEFNMN
jgi:hypothetical protein